jgi:hypothetical protein
MIQGHCECCNNQNIYVDKVRILLPIGLGEEDFQNVNICWECVQKVLYPAMNKFMEIKRESEKE